MTTDEIWDLDLDSLETRNAGSKNDGWRYRAHRERGKVVISLQGPVKELREFLDVGPSGLLRARVLSLPPEKASEHDQLERGDYLLLARPAEGKESVTLTANNSSFTIRMQTTHWTEKQVEEWRERNSSGLEAIRIETKSGPILAIKHY